jgi:hypothetical protein
VSAPPVRILQRSYDLPMTTGPSTLDRPASRRPGRNGRARRGRPLTAQGLLRAAASSAPRTCCRTRKVRHQRSARATGSPTRCCLSAGGVTISAGRNPCGTETPGLSVQAAHGGKRGGHPSPRRRPARRSWSLTASASGWHGIGWQGKPGTDGGLIPPVRRAGSTRRAALGGLAGCGARQVCFHLVTCNQMESDIREQRWEP